MEAQEPKIAAVLVSRTFRVLAVVLVLVGIFAVARIAHDVINGSRDTSERVWVLPLMLVWTWFFGTIAIRCRFPRLVERLMNGWGKKNKQVIDELFGQFLHPELVEGFKSPEFNSPLNTFREVKVGLIFVAIDGADASEVGRTHGLIADTSRMSGWYIDCMLSNLMIVTDGAPLPAAPEQISREQLVAKLREQFGQKIKLLHMDRSATWGSYGGRFRRNHGAMLFDLLDILSHLNAQPYGSERDITR